MKNPFEGSQLFRWGTPGWVLLISSLIFTSIDGLVNVVLGREPILFEHSVSFGKDSLAIAILVAGAGVPIGYILYQIYFCLRWNWPLAARGFLFVHGRIKDISETLAGVSIEKLLIGPTWSKSHIADSNAFSDGRVLDHRKAWYCLENLLIDYSSKDEGAERMYDRGRYLLDILHALGTGMFALILGWLIYVGLIIYAVKKLINFDYIQIIALLMTFLVLSILLVIFYWNRDNTRAQVISLHNFLLRRMVAEKELAAKDNSSKKA